MYILADLKLNCKKSRVYIETKTIFKEKNEQKILISECKRFYIT